MRSAVILMLLAGPALAQPVLSFSAGQRTVTGRTAAMCPSPAAMDEYLAAVRKGTKPAGAGASCLTLPQGAPVVVLDRQEASSLRVRVQYDHYNRKGLVGWTFASNLRP